MSLSEVTINNLIAEVACRRRECELDAQHIERLTAHLNTAEEIVHMLMIGTVNGAGKNAVYKDYKAVIDRIMRNHQ
jgi:hypothetical protein